MCQSSMPTDSNKKETISSLIHQNCFPLDSKLLTIRRKVTEIFRTEMFNFGARKIHAKSTYGDVIVS